jgi:hypothetical protein
VWTGTAMSVSNVPLLPQLTFLLSRFFFFSTLSFLSSNPTR